MRRTSRLSSSTGRSGNRTTICSWCTRWYASSFFGAASAIQAVSAGASVHDNCRVDRGVVHAVRVHQQRGRGQSATSGLFHAPAGTLSRTTAKVRFSHLLRFLSIPFRVCHKCDNAPKPMRAHRACSLLFALPQSRVAFSRRLLHLRKVRSHFPRVPFPLIILLSFAGAF